jgi:hypothetical protein
MVMLICIIVNILVLGYLIYITIIRQQPSTAVVIQQPASIDIQKDRYGNGKVWPPDVLNNQYAQPLRDTNYIQMALPSVATNVGYVNTSYRQIGVLGPHGNANHTNQHHDQELLILMGRPLYVNRNKWQYYVLSNQRNGVKLTVFVKGKPATNEYGVDELYTNDLVSVQGYRTIYRVELYENDYITYVP